ncbi:MAG: hypothetical protein LBG43_00355 [Treponema sp.]|nr:hypothetical protein [Treponema sp.]
MYKLDPQDTLSYGIDGIAAAIDVMLHSKQEEWRQKTGENFAWFLLCELDRMEQALAELKKDT